MAAIAVMVACGRNSASAATEDKSVNAPTTGQVAVPDVTVSDDGRRFAVNGPNYKTTLRWDSNMVSFSDMFLSTPAGSQKNLPLMDGIAWSSPQRQAGIYFMESVPGIGLHVIKCNDPKKTDNGDGTTILEWDDMYGYRSFRMNMDGNSATIVGYDPSTGEPVDNWFLSLITAREKGNDLPFTVIVPERVNSLYNGHEYHLGIGPGKAALNRDDTPPVFNIYPENGTITLTFDGR